jgi:putative methyltransferase (TIGR04325 family)
MSSVLQYLENPFKVLNYLLKKKVKYFLLLRTLVHNKNEEIKVQVVPKYIYKSNYPVRIFNQSLLLNFFFKNNYCLIKNSFKNEPIGDLLQKNFFFKLKNF